jgi:hypothetical protein
MKPHSVFGCGALVVSVLMGAEAAADPFDFFQVQYGVQSGVLLRLGLGSPTEYRDGVTLTLPIPTFLEDKNYSAQIVQPGSGEKSESYVQPSPTDKDYAFVSAVATASTVEVGVLSQTFSAHVGTAVSRMAMTIKNNYDDRSLTALEFDFEIPEGRVEYTDFSQRFLGVHSRVQAMIDYRLLSPPNGTGGPYEETTGQLFNYWVDLDDGKVLTRTSTATVHGFQSPSGSRIVYFIDPYSGTLRLPIIPPRGELTVFYDMYAIVSGGSETLAAAFLGDPTDLTDNGGFGLRLLEEPSDPGTVPAPEPTSLMLLGAGLLATAAKLRRR